MDNHEHAITNSPTRNNETSQNTNNGSQNNYSQDNNSWNYQKYMLDMYFMHSIYLSTVTLHLNNLNYHFWSRSIMVALRSKNKLGFLDGTLTHPNYTNYLSLGWDRCNTMVMSWITNSIKSYIDQSVLWMDTTHDIWTKLRTRYHQGDVFRISDIQEEFFNHK